MGSMNIRGVKLLFPFIVLAMTLTFMVACGSSTPAPSSSGSTGETEPGNSSGQNAGASPVSLRLATATVGGAWYAVGGAVAETIAAGDSGLTVTVGPGGSLANLRAVEEGSTELAFAYSSDFANGLEGKEPFETPLSKVGNIATLQLNYFQVVVYKDSDIYTMGDFKGRRLATVQRGTGSEVMTRDVLQAYALTYDDLSKVDQGTVADIIDLMKDGHTDGVSILTAVPGHHILDVGAMRDVRVIGIPQEKHQILREINSGYLPLTIPAGTYEAQGHVEEIVTMGTGTQLVASLDVPEEVVYRITKALIEGIDHLSAAHASLQDSTPETLAEDKGLPFHPGAERYYRERGLLD